MLTFNKIHVFSSQPDYEVNDDKKSPSHAELEQEAKRKALLAAVQKTGGIEVNEYRPH